MARKCAELNAVEVLEALEASSHLNGFYRFREFRIEAGYGYMAEKRIDLMTMDIRPSRRNERRAYEIKVSRSDFTRELRTPTKRWAGMLFTNRFYFVAPKGLIKTSEVPLECGLVEVDEHKCVRIKLQAPWRESFAPTWPFIISLMRAVEKANDKKTSDVSGG